MDWVIVGLLAVIFIYFGALIFLVVPELRSKLRNRSFSDPEDSLVRYKKGCPNKED